MTLTELKILIPPVKVVVEPVGEVVVVHVRESDAKPVQCSEGFSGGRAR